MTSSHAARVRTSSMLSIIFCCCGVEDDNGVIRWAHRVRRNAASASRKLGVAFFWYQGREIHVGVVPKVGMYQVQIAAYNHRESEAARSGPIPFHDWESSAPRHCLM